MGVDWQGAAKAFTKGVQSAANHSAKAAAAANGVSAASQNAQGMFNQGSANNANAIGTDRLLQQYQFNAGQAAAANNFSMEMWDKSAAWNEMMWEKQAEFNRQEAEKQRQWSQMMESTRYQRGMEDMSKAGLNPILAYGGIATGAGGGGAASVGGASMSPISGKAASGGTLNGLAASEGNYQGQMEYMAGSLGIFAAAIDGISAAYKANAELGNNSIFGQILNGLGEMLNSENWTTPGEGVHNPNTKYNQWKNNNNLKRYKERTEYHIDKFLNPNKYK